MAGPWTRRLPAAEALRHTPATHATHATHATYLILISNTFGHSLPVTNRRSCAAS
jgi:hypothetical protein